MTRKTFKLKVLTAWRSSGSTVQILHFKVYTQASTKAMDLLKGDSAHYQNAYCLKEAHTVELQAGCLLQTV